MSSSQRNMMTESNLDPRLSFFVMRLLGSWGIRIPLEGYLISMIFDILILVTVLTVYKKCGQSMLLSGTIRAQCS